MTTGCSDDEYLEITVARSNGVHSRAARFALRAAIQASRPSRPGCRGEFRVQATPRWHRSSAHGAFELSIYGTMGRSPDLPPIVSEDIRTIRVWIADGQYIEDTTEGTVEGQPYWRRGWLGYSNIDRRYEWVTIGPRVPMMIYLGKPGSGDQIPSRSPVSSPIRAWSASKPSESRRAADGHPLESHDRNVSELYFTPPGERAVSASPCLHRHIK